MLDRFCPPVLWRGVGATALSIGGGVRPFIRAGVAALMHLGLAGCGVSVVLVTLVACVVAGRTRFILVAMPHIRLGLRVAR